MRQITEHIWIFPFEEERDRPNLALVRGNRWTLAVEAGHSQSHVADFYRDLADSHLPCPDLTVVTHWHWDHTFGIPFVKGLTVAEERTNRHLRMLAKIPAEVLQDNLTSRDPYAAREYESQKMQVKPADFQFHDRMEINLGSVHAVLQHVPSPHTDDSVVILIPEDRTLFFGDAFSGPYPDYGNPDPEKFRLLWQEVEKMNFETAIGGHWPPMRKDELLRKFAGHKK